MNSGFWLLLPRLREKMAVGVHWQQVFTSNTESAVEGSDKNWYNYSSWWGHRNCNCPHQEL